MCTSCLCRICGPLIKLSNHRNYLIDLCPNARNQIRTHSGIMHINFKNKPIYFRDYFKSLKSLVCLKVPFKKNQIKVDKLFKLRSYI